MKKIFLTITSMILICIIFIGCSQADANIETSKELNKNLNLLSNTVSKLDSIENEFLVSNDLYSLNQITPSQSKIERIKIASSSNVLITQDNTIEDILKNEIINRLYCDENGNCKLCKEKYICDNNGNCNLCNQTIVCDENGNCNSCNSKLTINDNNSCSSCNYPCTTSDCNESISTTTLDNLKKISNYNQEVFAEQLNTTTTIDNVTHNDVDDNFLLLNATSTTQDAIQDTATQTEHIVSIDHKNTTETDPEIITDQNNDENANNQHSSLIEENTDNNDNIQPNIKYYYYSEEHFNPELLKYKPRFITNLNYSSANNNIERYVEKLQKLYTMTADVVEANNTLANYKIIVLNDIDEAKKLNENVLTGTYSTNSAQRQALLNYITDIKNTINNLRNCNGNLTSEINKISSGNTGIAQSLDITNSNYLRILNQIDTRISYHENAVATLEQIKYILGDAQHNQDNNENFVVEDFNNNQEIITDNSNTDNSDNTTDSNDLIIIEPSVDNYEDNSSTHNDPITTTPSLSNTDVDNNVENDNQNALDDNSNSNATDVNSTLSNTTDTSSQFDEEINNADLNNQEIDNKQDNEDNANSTDDQDTTINTTLNNDTEITDLDDQQDVQTNSENNLLNSENTDLTISSNIDTYQDNSFSNIIDNDATSPIIDNESTQEELKEDLDNTEIAENEVDNSDTNSNLVDKIEDNSSATSNNNNINNVTTNQTLDTPKMVNADNANNNLTNNNYYSNTLNENSIISQNNINGQDRGNSSYHYDEDGKLYNNTNGLNNNNFNSANNHNNNVNTYQYNTLIDSINRGTVNNGINNL